MQPLTVLIFQTHYLKLLPEVKLPKYTNGTGGDIKFAKTALVRKRHNTPLQPERFVRCDKCGRQDHEICRVYDCFSGVPYRCKQCVAETAFKPPQRVSADMLPHCYLSLEIENDVLAAQKAWLASPRLAESYVPSPSVSTPPGILDPSLMSPNGLLDQSALSPTPGETSDMNWACTPRRAPSLDNFSSDCSAQPITVRVVDCVADKCDVKPNMRARYPDAVTEFPYVRKVVLAFIDVDNAPICFFG
jgi:hypothetical protein